MTYTPQVCQVKGCMSAPCGSDRGHVCKNQPGHVLDSVQEGHLVSKGKLIEELQPSSSWFENKANKQNLQKGGNKRMSKE